ncbi:ATP-binding cassette domain-containing protein [Mycoplasma sp. 5370]
MFKYLNKEKMLTFFIAIIEMLISTKITFSLYIPGLINQYIQENNSKEFYFWITIEGCLLFFATILAFVRLFLKNKIFNKIQFHLREDILRSTVNENPMNFEIKTKGKFISQIQDQIPIIIERLYSAFFNLFFNIGSIICAIILAVISSWKLSIFILLFSFITTVIPLIISSFNSKKWKLLMKTFEEGNVKLSAFLSTYKMFYFLDVRHIFQEQLNNLNTKFRMKLLKIFSILFLVDVVTWYVITITDIALLIVTAYFILFENEMVANIIIIPALSFKISLSFRISSWFFVHYKSLKEKLEEFKSTPKNEKLFFKGDNPKFEELIIENLSYSYNEKNVIFKDFNLKIEKGKKYLIKGPSGSGKSTFLNIITKQINEYKGKILLNGYDLKEISQPEVNNFFTYLDSKEFVFFDTVYNNLTLWEQGMNNEAKEALEKVNLTEISLDYDINLNNSLSTGQKQRINFARTFLRNKNLLILDEALANIDKENIELIENFLFQNKELTILNISHHAENYEMYDYIIDMEKIKDEMIAKSI